MKYIALFWALFLCGQVNAQHTQSSYSVIGIGEVNWGGYSQNTGMGGLGVSYNSRFFLNNINPALMSSNFESVFQLGLAIDSRNVTGNTDTGNQSYSTTAGGFRDLGFVLPIKYAKWNMGFGLSPYTTVNYGFSTSDPNGPDGSTTIIDVEGRGGIDEVFWNNSLRFGYLQLGLKLSYLFGSVQTENLFTLDGLQSTVFGSSLVEERKNYSGVGATGGASYKARLGEDKFLNLGAFYTPESKVNSTRLSTLQNITGGGVVLSADTLVDNLKSKITLPARLGFGLSYEKLQTVMLGVDFLTQDWTQFVGESGADQAYGKSFRFAIGGEIVPNYQDLKLLNRISYRFGVHYERTPYLVNGQDVNDIGINLGASVPLSAFWGVSHVNLGATFGRRGNITNDRIRENYFKIHLGFSLQDLTWFSRGKFD